MGLKCHLGHYLTSRRKWNKVVSDIDDQYSGDVFEFGSSIAFKYSAD